MAKRKRVSADIRDRLLVESMHRCSLCPEHYDITDVYHIVAIDEDAPDTADNLMVVCPGCHAKIHRFRTVYTPEQLRLYKDRWLSALALDKKVTPGTLNLRNDETVTDVKQRDSKLNYARQIDFSRMANWKAFEKLVADLLEAEGFRILREPSIDRSGIDILAEETIASHSGLVHTVRWFVQCKHYAGSGRSLARQEVEQILYNFDVRTEDALLIVTDTDVTEEGFRVLEEYAQRPSAKRLIKVWNRRELENRLLRHPVLTSKYRISTSPLPLSLSPFDGLDLEEKRILVVSDTSPFAYQLFTSINRVNANAQMIVLWQYGDSLRCEALLKDVLAVSYDLIIFFLGDSFAFPIPQQLVTKLIETARAGRGVMLFPFFAWALYQGAYPSLEELVPVRLVEEPRREQLWLKASRMLSVGDISWLNTEAFIENQSVVIRVGRGHPILDGIAGSFGIIHSYEFLNVKEGTRCVLSDNLGTPFLVINEAVDAPVVYINSCMHNCLTITPILSPFEVSEAYQSVIVNSVLWCVGLSKSKK